MIDPPKSKKIFDPTFTIGNAVTIAVFLIGGLIGYVRLTAAVDMLASAFYEHRLQQVQTEAALVRKDVQETRNKFIDEKLNEMNTKLDILLKQAKIGR